MAATFDVSNLTEFQSALTTAQANGENDTINVAAGTINVNTTLTYTAVASENFSLTIAGSDQADTFLDGGSSVQIMRIDTTAVTSDGAISIILRGMIFENGVAVGAPNENGGALVILTNEDQQPAEFPQTIDIRNSEFHNSTAAGDGGALYIRAHAAAGMFIVDTDFVGNQAGGHGGAAFIAGGVFTTPIDIVFVDFYNNVAGGNGGALRVAGFDSATPSEDRANHVFISNVAFYNNRADSTVAGGGGANISGLTIGFDGCGFIDNQALEGGGLRVGTGWSSFRMTNTGFVGNTANDFGGGLAIKESMFMELILANNTIYENFATSSGGGAYILIDGSSSIAYINNNIIYGNATEPGTSDDLYIDNQFYEDTGAPVELFHNDITTYEIGPVAPTGVATNIDADPIFVDMTLRPQPGERQPLPDPRLQAGSPAIDAGLNDAPGAPSYDFDGDDRPLDGDGDTVAIIDIGMDEFSGEPTQNVDLGVTKSDSPDPVTEGEDITYSIVVTN